MQTEALYEKLKKIRHFKNKSDDILQQQCYIGSGKVKIDSSSKYILEWIETGCWQQPIQLDFSNHYRWQLNHDQQQVKLLHCRYGEMHPVELLQFSFDIKQNQWLSEQPHICIDDCYNAIIAINSESIVLNWNIRGPKKHLQISIQYY